MLQGLRKRLPPPERFNSTKEGAADENNSSPGPGRIAPQDYVSQDEVFKVSQLTSRFWPVDYRHIVIPKWSLAFEAAILRQARH